MRKDADKRRQTRRENIYAQTKTRDLAERLFMKVLLYSPEAACHDLVRSLGISEW